MLSKKYVIVVLALFASLSARAGEAEIRKSFAEKLKDAPPIEEVRPTPMPGVWEVRMGGDLHYTDDKGLFILQGELIDLKTRKSLTEERLTKINAIDFNSLPLKDAIVWVKGNGKRRIAVFADPNCGFCKKLERSLQDVKDVTVYTFVIAILGGDSPEKARAIWCNKDSTNVWRNWMLDGTPVPKAQGACDDSALVRNLALARKHRVTGTPAIAFEDGSRAPGAINAEQIERKLAGPAPKS
ncbi:MAG TPA: DsbC family protein [Burkholderiaceae bacterium]